MSSVDAANDPRGGWVEFRDIQGRRYYHNRITGQSVWEKPNEFKSPEELAQKVAYVCPWREYTADSGRKFYYNNVTGESRWDEPAEYKAWKESGGLEAEQAQQEQQAEEGSPKDGDQEEESTYKTHEERVEAFKSLLIQASVTSTWTWDMTMRAIINDDRYRALTSLSEKKKVLQEFQLEKRKQEREEKRKKDQKLRESFIQMLKECAQLTQRMSWKKAQPYFEGDARFSAVPEREREDLYEDYLVQVERQTREAERQKKRENMRKFRERLLDDPTIGVTTQWRRVKEKFQNDPDFTVLEKLDRLQVFEDYIRDLERDEEEKKRIEAQKQNRHSRLNREAFRELLNELYDKNELDVFTKWKDLLKVIRDDPRYKAMISPDQTGSLPSELFGDFLEDLEDKFSKDKKKLKGILKEGDFRVTTSTTQDELISAVSSHPKFETIDQKHYQLLFEELRDKAERAEKKVAKDSERSRKKMIGKFMDLLDSTKEVTPSSTWESVKPLLENHSAFQKIESDSERKRIFEDFLHKRKDESSEEEGIIHSDGEVYREGEKYKSPSRSRDKSDDDSSDRHRREKRHKKEKRDKKEKKHRRSRDEDDERRSKRSRHSRDSRDLPSRKLTSYSSEEEGQR